MGTAEKIDRAGCPVAGFSGGIRPVSFRITAVLGRRGSGPKTFGQFVYKHLRRRKAAEGMGAPLGTRGSLGRVTRWGEGSGVPVKEVCEIARFLYFFAFLPFRKKFVNTLLKPCHPCHPGGTFLFNFNNISRVIRWVIRG
jgi:hypothetical protein